MADLIDRDALEPFYESGTDPDDSYADMTYIRAEHIENAPAVNRWIPCSEQMMPNGEKVLVCLTNGEFFVMRRSNDVITDGLRHLTDLSGVTHWMPLPEPPKEGEDHA